MIFFYKEMIVSLLMNFYLLFVHGRAKHLFIFVKNVFNVFLILLILLTIVLKFIILSWFLFNFYFKIKFFRMNLNFFGVDESRLNNGMPDMITPHWFPFLYVICNDPELNAKNNFQIKKWFKLK